MGLQGLPTEVKERFLWRAIVIKANHPLVITFVDDDFLVTST